MRRSLTIIALVFLATMPGCAFLDDVVYGHSQRQYLRGASSASPNERIQAQIADAHRKLDAEHPNDDPSF
jgi:hypothetical protein